MWLNSLFLILCLALAVSFDYVSAVVCGDSMFFTPNGTYDTNRRLVLATLASNVISQDGYYNVSVGEGPGMIYALGMCISGTEPQTCSDCIQAARTRQTHMTGALLSAMFVIPTARFTTRLLSSRNTQSTTLEISLGT